MNPKSIEIYRYFARDISERINANIQKIDDRLERIEKSIEDFKKMNEENNDATRVDRRREGKSN